MKTLFFKPRIPVEMHEIKELLEKEFPEYEYSLFGVVGKGLKVKKSTFKGVRIIKGVGRIFVKKTPPTLLGAIVDQFLFGMIGDIMNAKMASQIVTLLRDRYC
jgi:hypothetical protein